jgi:apolipoprotein N-acyltransferase
VAETAATSAGWRGCWRQRLAALLAGAVLTAAFAPHNLWGLAVLAPAALLLLWRWAPTPREGAWLGWLFGIGLYATGTWWLYISIRVIGQAPILIALLVMGALVLLMAAYQAGLGYVVVRWLQPRTVSGTLLKVPAAWVIVEWWRGWFVSGFPWLSLGYSQTDTWLAGLAPVGGVHLISVALLISAGALVLLLRDGAPWRPVALVALVLPWTAGLALRNVQWTQPRGEALSVAILQGAIPQELKWLDSKSNQQKILDEYASLHDSALGARLIVWPESALPDLANYYSNYLGSVWSSARRHGSAVLMGVMRAEQRSRGEEPVAFNSVLALDVDDPAFYDKRHLVPFGEYFPVPQIVRDWLRLMNLPHLDFMPGAANQPPMKLAGEAVAVSICYEDAYPRQLRDAMARSSLLATVTNDAWFGRSGARYQHLQIARMLAIESRRYLLRAANDGVSAVIDPSGRVVRSAPEFKAAVLRGTVQPRTGMTSYLRFGDWPILGLAAFVMLLSAVALLKTRANTSIKKH